jgi:hypothetical protein
MAEPRALLVATTTRFEVGAQDTSIFVLPVVDGINVISDCPFESTNETEREDWME